MRSFYQLAFLALPLVGTVVCAEPASQTKDAKPVYANANEAFHDLLNALPEESLHAALNSLGKFQEGIFESHRHGVERVHHDNPPLATKLIVAAVQDLKKRQVQSNGTQTLPPQSQTSLPPVETQTPSSQAPAESSDAPPASSDAPASSGAPASSEAPASTPAPESSQAPASSAPPPVVVPVPVTQTDSSGHTTVVSSVIFSEATAFVPVPVTRTNAQGQTEVATVTQPAVIFTATNAQGSSFLATSAVNFAPTKGQVITTTNAQGSTFLTTYTPGGGLVSSIKLITTTGRDGRPTVVTSYAFVNPAAPTEPTGSQAGAPAPTTGKPKLQSGAAQMNRAMEAAMLGGAVGGAFAFWI
jgi:hypothetical protein